jgi:hypothetical protein
MDKKSQDYINKDRVGGSIATTSVSVTSLKSTQIPKSTPSVRKVFTTVVQSTTQAPSVQEKKVHFDSEKEMNPVTPLMKVPQRSILKSPKPQSNQIPMVVNSTPSTPASRQKINVNRPQPGTIQMLTSTIPTIIPSTPSKTVSQSLNMIKESPSIKLSQFKKENDILSKLSENKNDQWTTRVLMIEQISSHLKEGDIKNTTNFAKIMIILLDGLSDSHYRVVLETLNCLIDCIPNFKVECEEYLEKFTLPC